MKEVRIVPMPDGTFAPASQWPEGTVEVRGDIEEGWYYCYEEQDEIPPPAVPRE